MKISLKRNTSGTVAGKQYLMIEDANHLIGYIQPTYLGFEKTGIGTYYIAKSMTTYDIKLCDTFKDACDFLKIDCDKVCKILPEGWSNEKYSVY